MAEIDSITPAMSAASHPAALAYAELLNIEAVPVSRR
jgi:hypothetical protein